MDDGLISALYTNCGAIFLKLGDWGRALRACEDALEFDPRSAKALYRAAKAAQALGNVIQAARFCERALKLRPRDQDVLALQASLIEQYVAQGEREAG